MIIFASDYMKKAQKRGVAEVLDMITANIMFDPMLIWDKIRHFYIESQSGADIADIIVNPNGVAIMRRLGAIIANIRVINNTNPTTDTITKGGEYRTRRKAGDIISLPRNLATITLPNWEHGVSLLSDGNAHLEPIQALATDSLKFEDGVLYFENSNGYRETFTEAHLQRISTREGITEIDLPLLRFYYSAILKQFEAKVKELRQKGDDDWNSMRKILSFMSVTFYVPELMERLGSGNFSERDAKKLISKTYLFSRIPQAKVFEYNFIRGG